MNKAFNNFLFICGEIWKSIGLAQKVSIVLVGALGALAISVVIYLGTRPNWQPLYTNLDTETAAEVYQVVNDEGVPVKTRDGGRTILVPFQHVNDLKMKVANADIMPESTGVGLELFDNVKIGLTEMQQQVGLQRALQGELQRMIAQLPGVENARVMLALPKRRIFQNGSAGRAKASVFIQTRPGKYLGQDQINAIRHTVASAIDSMAADDVTVSDNNGRLLAKGTTTSGENGDSLMDRRLAMEETLKQKVESLLNYKLGPGAAVAMVTLDVDFDQSERIIETYDSASAVVLNEKVVTEEQAKPTGSKTQGATGVSGNLPTVSVNNPAPAAEEAQMATESRKTVENNYAVPKTINKVKTISPKIRQLSVAVTVARKDAETTRTAAELDALTNLVKSTVGAINNPETGRIDQVVVTESEFNSIDKMMANTTTEASVINMNSMEKLVNSPVLRPITGLILLIFLWYLFGSNFKKGQVRRIDLSSEMGYENSYNVEPVKSTEILPPAVEQSSIDLVSEETSADPKVIANAIEFWINGSES